MKQNRHSHQFKHNVLQKESIQIKTETLQKYFDIIVPLNENNAFIYFEDGSYEVFDLSSKQIIGKGQIVTDIKSFIQIYPETLCFLDPEDMKVKLLDLKSHKENPSFVFASSKVINQNSEKQYKETFANQFQIMILDREKDKIQYLITQDLEKQYSNNNTCHFVIRAIPQKYTPDTLFDLNPIFEYDYQNKTEQTNLCNWQIDEETVVVFGQDDEFGKEILLIKPHLVEKAFYIIHIKDEFSQTLINVTNWIFPHLIAIWQNNNDENSRPTLFTIDIRQYYDGQNWLPEPDYNPTKVKDDFFVGNEPVTFMDIYQFYLNSSYILQFRLVGVQPRLSLINYPNFDNPELNTEVKLDEFFHKLPSNKNYFLSYDDLQINNGILKFSIFYPADPKCEILKIIENTKLIDKYGIDSIKELFEFYK
ncbi:unnamed protein product [Paramecium sonneborni]|uniref:Uncharacterized protein n=1 Tax=Paramecium sonneborni TaxID=65129 RepID=A0A8S1MZR4_9CILI|nr:unnamed protein product [Paramecium sonneborni]